MRDRFAGPKYDIQTPAIWALKLHVIHMSLAHVSTALIGERWMTLILQYVHGFLNAPRMEIAQPWHGVYAKHPGEPYLVIPPALGVRIVASLGGGADMTLSFGIADETIENLDL